MAILLTTAFIKHERRVRLFFSVTLASGAFAASLYSVASSNGNTPNVVAALSVASSPEQVELVLDADLTQGAAYSFSAPSVPGSDMTSTPSPSVAVATFGSPTIATAVGGIVGAISVSESDARLFGIDLVIGDGDYVEDDSGDLATVGGLANLSAAVQRRGLSEGLAWDFSFGVHPRQYVDGTVGGLAPLRKKSAAEIRRDDRVQACRTSIVVDPATSSASLVFTIQPRSWRDVALSVSVPIRSK